MVVVGYRKMAGLTQKDMARRLNISEGTYRNKEKGKTSFKEKEIKKFYELVSKENPSVNIEDIFFTH